MENEIDLHGVDPARWPEIRRRVAVLDEYIAIWRPDAKTRQAYADRLDISPSTLSMLARIWRKDRSAANLPGAQVQKKVRRRPGLPARTREISLHVISELGSTSRQRAVQREIERRCAVEGLAPPSASTISSLMMEARADADIDGLDPEFLIEECALKIPVAYDEKLAMPRVLLAMVLPQRRIVGWDIAFDPAAQTSLATVLEAVEAASKPNGMLLPLRAPHRSALEREVIGAQSKLEGIGKPGLSKVLGPRLGTIPVAYRLWKAITVERLLSTRHDKPIGIEDATRAIIDAITAHNDRMPDLPEAGFRTGPDLSQS